MYAKEVAEHRGACLLATPPSKTNHRMTAVQLYLDPRGCVSVVDILVEEGLNMDYAIPYVIATPQNGGSSLGSPEPWKGSHVTKKTPKSLLDLPTVSENGLCDDCFSSENPLPDLNNSVVKLENSGWCALDDDGHVTPPGIVIGQKVADKNQVQPILSPWQAFQNFCKEYL